MQLLKQHIEALIFTADNSISTEEIQSCLKTVYDWDLSTEEIRACIDELQRRYEGEEFAFELTELAGGFQFMSKKEYHTIVSALLQLKAKKRLSTAAMETLAIIAYKQPVSKAEVEHLRGVNSDYSIQKLLEKDLIVIDGKGEGPGKPIIYSASKSFMDHFGLKTMADLPKLKDLHIADNEIGSPADLEPETVNMTHPENDEMRHAENEVNLDELLKSASVSPNNEADMKPDGTNSNTIE